MSEKLMNESYIPIIKRTVSGLKGLQVPFERAICSSSAEMYPLLSLSTLKYIRLEYNFNQKYVNSYLENTSQRNSRLGIGDANDMADFQIILHNYDKSVI